MKRFILGSLTIFLLSFIYLHQKVLICIEAYQIDKYYQEYNKLVDTRDNLLYNFSQRITMERVNGWAKKNNFLIPQEGKILVLNIEKKKAKPIPSNIALFINRLFNLSSPGPKALAESD